MLDTVLGYLPIVLFSAAFGVAYFAWLESSMDKILSGKKSPAYIHLSFMLRLAFAILFFRVMLIYYPGLWEQIVVVATFVAARYFVLKRGARR
jgi:hypothetical protein